MSVKSLRNATSALYRSREQDAPFNAAIGGFGSSSTELKAIDMATDPANSLSNRHLPI